MIFIQKEKRVVERWRHAVARTCGWRVHGSGYSGYASVISQLPLMLFLLPLAQAGVGSSSPYGSPSLTILTRRRWNGRSEELWIPSWARAKRTTSTAAATSPTRSYYTLNHERATHVRMQPGVATFPQLSSLF